MSQINLIIVGFGWVVNGIFGNPLRAWFKDYGHGRWPRIKCGVW